MNVHLHILHRTYHYFIHVLWDGVGPYFAWFLAEELPAMVIEIGPSAKAGCHCHSRGLQVSQVTHCVHVHLQVLCFVLLL